MLNTKTPFLTREVGFCVYDICISIVVVNGVDTGKITHSLSSGLKGFGHDVGYKSSILGNARLRQETVHYAELINIGYNKFT